MVSDMGLDIRVARNDRSRSFCGESFGSMRRMVEVLPTQFNEVTQRTIELNDVLQRKGNYFTRIRGREHDLSQLVAAPHERFGRTAAEPGYHVIHGSRRGMPREGQAGDHPPDLELLQKPLSKVCGFISFSTWRKKMKGIQDLGHPSSIRPEFLDKIAEYFE